MNLLELKHVSKHFGGLTAVGDVNLSVPKDSIYGLIGPNGAGKTTIFNLVTGIYELSEGEILFEGQKINGLASFKIANLGITRTFQNIRLFKEISTFDNVLTACQHNAHYTHFDAMFRTPKYRRGEKQLIEETEQLLEILHLTERREVVAKNLPYGYQRRLEIARAVALKPKLLLLDEPAAGMNPDETLELAGMIREIRQRFGLTVLIIEHHMDLIMSLCERIMVLNFGRELAEGDPDSIQADPKVIEAYLGEGGDQ